SAPAQAPRAEAPRPTLAAHTAQPQPAAAPAAEVSEAVAALATFDDVLALIRERRDAKLLVTVETGLRLVSYQPGRIVFEPSPSAPASLAADLGERLRAWTGARWMVAVESSGGAPTVAEQRDAERDDLHARLREHPLVRAALDAFPEAEILATRAFGAEAPAEETQTAPEWEEAPDEDDWEGWDPVDVFEERP
ncbi:MAG: DNA polymerase III subunit gamma/tau, partial [Pseudomonadota bacterium]|nr:DNA polymerase III subunit gamma/tau [Pseudomonadota bacterium]